MSYQKLMFVKLDFNLVITGNDSSGAAMTITGVPFTATTANSESTNNPMIRYFDFDSGTIDVLMYHYSRTSTIEFYEISDDSNWSIIRRDQITITAGLDTKIQTKIKFKFYILTIKHI